MSDQFEPSVIDLSASAIQLIRTALSNPKVTLDKTGLKSYDASGNLVTAINADGTATLSGFLAAQGVTVPAGQVGRVGQANQIRWTQAAGGAVVASIDTEFDVSGKQNINLVAGQASGMQASLQLQGESDPAGPAAAYINAGAQLVTLLDSNQKSGFPQLAQPKKLIIYGILDTGVSASVAADTEVNLTLNLSTLGFNAANISTGVAIGGLYDGSFAARFGWRFSYGGSNVTIVLHNLHTTQAGSAGWRGIFITQ